MLNVHLSHRLIFPLQIANRRGKALPAGRPASLAEHSGCGSSFGALCVSAGDPIIYGMFEDSGAYRCPKAHN